MITSAATSLSLFSTLFAAADATRHFARRAIITLRHYMLMLLPALRDIFSLRLHAADITITPRRHDMLKDEVALMMVARGAEAAVAAT